MASIFTAIILIVGLVVVASVFGIGSEVAQDVQEDLTEKQDALKDQEDSSIIDTGNFASDIGADVCNLNVKFFGSVEEDDVIINESQFNDDRFLFMGSQPPELIAFQSQNNKIREYTWYCNLSNPLSFFSFGANSFSFFKDEESSGETIRIKWVARSIDTGKFMIDINGNGDNNNPFSQETKLPVGKSFPIEWVIEDFFEGVTNDDYQMEYWSDQYKINTKDIGYRFKIDLCENNKPSC